MAGCGSKDGLARVKGTVTLDGEPLEGAVVQFQPTGEGGSPSAGITDADGQYELMYTFDKPGAVPGEHVVTIRMADAYYGEEDVQPGRRGRVPAQRTGNFPLNPAEFKRTVEPGSNTIDFEL